jgi:expansin
MGFRGLGRAGLRTPRRGNRIWLITTVVTVLVLTGLALRWPVAPCHPAAAAAVPGRTGLAPGLPRLTPAAWRREAGAVPGTAAVADRGVFSDPGRDEGSCSLGPFPAQGWYASLPAAGYARGTACGSYLTVRGPAGTVRVEVVDLCADCAPGTVDLSRAAFRRIASPRSGTVPVRYQPVPDPPLPGPLALRVAVGGGPVRLAVQILDHGNPLAAVAARSAHGGRWVGLTPEPDGYWAWPAGWAGPGRASIRIGDIRGHLAVLTGVPLGTAGPGTGAVLHSRVWMYQATRPLHAGSPARYGTPAQDGPAQDGSPTGPRRTHRAVWGATAAACQPAAG